MDNRTALLRTASISALLGNLALAIAKIVTAISSGSLAVLGDGIDSSLDVAISIMTLCVAVVIAKPADKNHPWGHARAETIATALLGCILFFCGAELIQSSIAVIASGTVRELPKGSALIVTIVSIAGKLLLASTQYIFGKKAASPMLLANAKNMVSDIFLSGGVLIGLIFTHILQIGIIDSIAALLVGLWVIKSAIEIFAETNTELMDGAKNTDAYKSLFEAVRLVKDAGNPHRVRMRKIAGLWAVDIDIELDPHLSVKEAHSIATQVEDAIKNNVEGIYDIMVHIEPRGITQHGEKYGLSENEL